MVEWTPHRPATIEDIIRVYKKEHRIEMILLEDEKKKKKRSERAGQDRKERGGQDRGSKRV